MGRMLEVAFHVTAADLPGRLYNHLLRLDLSHSKRMSADGRRGYDWWGADWDMQTEGYW